MFHSRTTHGPVDLAFTDRDGGVSAVPYDGTEELRRVLDVFAPEDRWAGLHQVHGAAVADATPGSWPEADGIVTTEAGLTLVVRAADCVPVLFADVERGVIGAAHSGRPGMVAGVVGATVARMRERGATAITAWIGPHICGACYEVPAAMQAEVGALVPAAVATTSWGTPSLDIGAGVRAQLDVAGVEIVDAGACTRESAELFSYRRDGDAAGRLVGLIRMRP